MPQITWRWFLSLLISLLTAGMCVAEVEGSPELKHRIRAFKTDVAIRLDGDLAKWRGAGTVTSEGKSLAGHPRHATVYALWIFTWPSMCIPRNFRPASVNATVWEDDGVEFLIDASSDRATDFLPDDFSYHINILNAVSLLSKLGF